MNNEILNMAQQTGHMFLFLATELTILFLTISYLVGVLQEVITAEKVQSILSSKNGKGYFIAALLGAITPFCSCSTIPFLKGLLRARAGFGPMMVFLFASPLLNPVIIGLFVMTFGWKVAIFYFAIAMTVAVVSGYVLEKLGFERYVRQEAYQQTTSCNNRDNGGCGNDENDTTTATQQIKAAPANACCSPLAKKETPKHTCCDSTAAPIDATATTDTAPTNRWLRIWNATWKDFKQVLPYLLLGIFIGSFIYGFIPTEVIARYAGNHVWYAIPIAAVIGIPLYIRAEAVIPLSAALVQKGMALGSVMALIIGSAGASLTEVILLKSIFKNQMIAAFLAVILGMAIGAGYLYNSMF
ncbi:permease [Vibrio rarus]|uniref:permease n=1 Tax=Vibrio rarus TaxID=413403 RepID=UPI0021C2DAC1|nr:permease [Vibrio rarus]